MFLQLGELKPHGVQFIAKIPSHQATTDPGDPT
jgi:hypothetical protein